MDLDNNKILNLQVSGELKKVDTYDLIGFRIGDFGCVMSNQSDCCETFGMDLDVFGDSESELSDSDDNSDSDTKPTYTINMNFTKDDDAGGSYNFNITSEKKSYNIKIYNYHNGYYSHTVWFEWDGDTIYSTYL